MQQSESIMSKKSRPFQWQKFANCDSGAVAVEYSIIAGAMFLAISPAFYIMRDTIWDKFTFIADTLAGM